jgi:colicin import membrane protein
LTSELDLAETAWLLVLVIPRTAAFLALVAWVGPAGLARAETAVDHRAAAEAELAKLEASPEARALAKDSIRRSRHALDRARRARSAGDHRHGAELEALADELVQTGKDLVITAKAEQALAELETRRRELEARTVRARALVEQTVARRGRAAEQLARIQAERSGPAAASPTATSKPAPAPSPKAPPAAPAKPAPAPSAAPGAKP